MFSAARETYLSESQCALEILSFQFLGSRLAVHLVQPRLTAPLVYLVDRVTTVTGLDIRLVR